jgi:hypothetical protein
LNGESTYGEKARWAAPERSRKMRRSIVLATLVVWATTAAQANEGVELSNKARSSAAAGAVTVRQSDAPFRAGRDPLPEILMGAEQESRGPSGACESTSVAVCYDMADRRVVYRSARKYMPKFDGLTAESVSLRRDRIVLKYSF